MKSLLACLLIVVFLVTFHISYRQESVKYIEQLEAQLRSAREIWNRVFDYENNRLMITPWAGAQNRGFTETEVLNRVFDAANNRLTTSAGGGEGGGAETIADLGSGTAVGKAYVIGTGSSITTSGSGTIAVTDAAEATNALVGCVAGLYAKNYLSQDWAMDCSQVLFSQLGGAATDAQIPDLNTLGTGLTGGRCVQTNVSNGKLEVAAGACGTGEGGGASNWGELGGTLADQTDLQAALDAKQDALGFTAVPTTRTVCGDALSGNVTCTKSDVSLGSVDDKSSATLHTEDRDESGARNIPRTQEPADAASVTVNPFNTHVLIAELSQATTFEIPTGTAPFDGQIIEIDIFTSDIQTLTFDTDPNGYCENSNIAFPTASLADQHVILGVKWSAVDTCWGLVSTNLSESGGGTGNVSSSGTPTVGQIAQWVDVDHIEGVGSTGTGVVVRKTSPELETPVLGTPTSINLANATGLPLATGVTGDLAFANMVQASDSCKLVGRGDGGAGDLQQLSLGTGFSCSGTTVNYSLGTGTMHLFAGSPKLPTSDAAIVDSGGNLYKVGYDETISWCAWWQIEAPKDYSGSPVFEATVTPTGNSSGSLIFNVSVMAVTPGDAAVLDTDDYDTTNTCTLASIPTTGGHPARISCALTNNDSMAAEDALRIKVCRNISDTAGTRMNLSYAVVQYTKAN